MRPRLLPDQVTRVVDRAVLAPSIHNSQPWRFHSDGETLEIWIDRRRHLPGIDPTGRQLTLSVGAAAEYARLALRAEGFEVSCAVMPDADNPDLAVRLTPVRPCSVDAHTRALVHCMPRRHTYRQPFDARPVPDEVVTRLREAAHASGCGTLRLTREHQPALAVLLDHAEQAELDSPLYREELARWRTHESHPGDGVPDSALAHGRRRVSRVPLRRFDPDSRPTVDAPRVDDPLLLLITTEHDTPADWVEAGRSAAQLLLHATAAGLQASPVTQSLDHDPDRRRTASLLGVVSHPQLIVRLGYGRAVSAAAAPQRRPIPEVLSYSGTR